MKKIIILLMILSAWIFAQDTNWVFIKMPHSGHNSILISQSADTVQGVFSVNANLHVFGIVKNLRYKLWSDNGGGTTFVERDWWGSDNGNWTPAVDMATGGGGLSSIPLDSLTQTGAASGQIPKWDGSKWAPANDETGGGGSGGTSGLIYDTLFFNIGDSVAGRTPQDSIGWVIQADFNGLRFGAWDSDNTQWSWIDSLTTDIIKAPGAGGAWEPSDDSGLLLSYSWDDAATITKDGLDRVSEWRDQSATDTMISSVNPLWHFSNGIYSASSRNDRLIGTYGSNHASHSLFLLLRMPNPVNNANVFVFNGGSVANSNQPAVLSNSDSTLSFVYRNSVGSNQVRACSTQVDQWSIIEHVRDGDSVAVWIDGIAELDKSIMIQNSYDSASDNLGWVSGYLAGDFYIKCIFLTSSIDTTTRAQYRTFLEGK